MQEQISGADPAKARELLTGYLDDAIGATQEAAAAIGEAGAPEVDGGGTIAQAIIGVLGQVEQVFTAARDKVADLPDDRVEPVDPAECPAPAGDAANPPAGGRAGTLVRTIPCAV